jgi:hypothetical protein
VKVWGKEVTETREHEGKKFYDVVVWSDRVELAVARDSDRSPAPQQQSQQEPWAASAPTPQSGGYSDETPF